MGANFLLETEPITVLPSRGGVNLAEFPGQVSLFDQPLVGNRIPVEIASRHI
jgi:hypothetical protein